MKNVYNSADRLNPFYFRAGLLQIKLPYYYKHDRLNPFYFRAGLLRCDDGGCDSFDGLNPFYFRAGLLPRIVSEVKPNERLNPFYFRAGLLRSQCLDAAELVVLIPFISGLDCYRRMVSGICAVKS